MNTNDIREVLIEKIQEIQALNGIDQPIVTIDTKPFRELSKFDSMTALEVLVELESHLENLHGIDVDFDISVFTNRNTQNGGSSDPLDITIEEISSNILKQID